ncbi:C45 family peptidase [Streptomyces marincola]|uniref:Peptidase C45 hydrolase domain-containing protein n=1 Tax=Streptomyces marincola TaxID=2878388 RepID=A0A1W7CZP0_9ACTN|nr:C45 family peptidase [Streptomyces marincola]ARQ70301.1 hypothetical protein CAG99_16925 [Streptomyces marincola]
MDHHLVFHALDGGDGTDGRWAGPVLASLPAQVERWLPEAGRTPEAERAAHARFAAHMPELLPVLDLFTAQAGGAPGAVPLLAQVGLNNPFGACTQVGGVAGTLLRNYDWDLGQRERTVVRSRLLRPVLGMTEGFWGLLDGMNDAGLAVSLTYGGRTVHGDGFAMPIVLRYLLETCATVAQAVAALGRLPVATAQNVTLVDAEQAVTLYLGPDIAPVRAPDACAANHQHLPVPQEQERETRTHARLAGVRAAAAAAGKDPEAVVAALLRPPLHEAPREGGYGTAYTAAYRPADGLVTYHWPGEEPWRQSFADFRPGTREVTVRGPAAD